MYDNSVSSMGDRRRVGVHWDPVIHGCSYIKASLHKIESLEIWVIIRERDMMCLAKIDVSMWEVGKEDVRTHVHPVGDFVSEAEK